jgi:hypothetical protein
VGRSILSTSRRSKGAQAYREIARRLLNGAEVPAASTA